MIIEHICPLVVCVLLSSALPELHMGDSGLLYHPWPPADAVTCWNHTLQKLRSAIFTFLADVWARLENISEFVPECAHIQGKWKSQMRKLCLHTAEVSGWVNMSVCSARPCIRLHCHRPCLRSFTSSSKNFSGRLPERTCWQIGLHSRTLSERFLWRSA